MGMFNVWMGGSICCTNVSGRNHVRKGEFVFYSMPKGMTSVDSGSVSLGCLLRCMEVTGDMS